VIEAQKAGHSSGFFCNNPKLTDKCDPEMTSSQVNKAALLQQVWRAIRSQDLKQAITCSNKLNGTFPDFAPGWHASSHLAQMVNQPRKALLAIDRALKLESGRPGNYWDSSLPRPMEGIEQKPRNCPNWPFYAAG
jgi:hypothetical protein